MVVNQGEVQGFGDVELAEDTLVAVNRSGWQTVGRAAVRQETNHIVITPEPEAAAGYRAPVQIVAPSELVSGESTIQTHGPLEPTLPGLEGYVQLTLLVDPSNNFSVNSTRSIHSQGRLFIPR